MGFPKTTRKNIRYRQNFDEQQGNIFVIYQTAAKYANENSKQAINASKMVFTEGVGFSLSELQNKIFSQNHPKNFAIPNKVQLVTSAPVDQRRLAAASTEVTSE